MLWYLPYVSWSLARRTTSMYMMVQAAAAARKRRGTYSAASDVLGSGPGIVPRAPLKGPVRNAPSAQRPQGPGWEY